MKINKAVITAAAPGQRTLPLQTLVDRDGVEKTVLRILVEEALRAGVKEVCLVVSPGDEGAYEQAAGRQAARLWLVPQREPRGYGHAVWCAREFTAGEAFLHMVGDHLYVGRDARGCGGEIVEAAEAEECSISAVRATREGLLQRFGAVGGQPVAGRASFYRVDTVLEKPTLTEAEQRLIVPGLRAGHYLCFFGMHVLTPAVMAILEELLARDGSLSLSAALAVLARREKYLALEKQDRRYDLGARFGLFMAQAALALAGQDRAEVLAQLVELLAMREAEPAP